jgi:glutaredoxin
MTEVVLYGREGCCLCEDARAVLDRVRERVPFTFEERDIEGDDRLLAAYLERIPVVTIDGIEVFELFVDESDLREALARSRPSVE